MKQAEIICDRFGIQSPGSASAASTFHLNRLEAILAEGLGAIALALQSREITMKEHASRGVKPFSTIHQGVIMDGDELGELGALLEDPLLSLSPVQR